MKRKDVGDSESIAMSCLMGCGCGLIFIVTVAVLVWLIGWAISLLAGM